MSIIFYDNDWEFPFERLVLGDRLGAGAFGEVYKAEAMGILALNPRDKTAVASKRRSKLRRSLRASQRPYQVVQACEIFTRVCHRPRAYRGPALRYATPIFFAQTPVCMV